MIRRLYGSSRWHLLGLVLSFVVTGYAAVSLLGGRPVAVVVWFIGLALLHDLVLAPLYTLLDRSAGPRRAWPWWWNHVRFPAAFSLLLLLVFAPEITRRGGGTFRAATGFGNAVYLGRWLWVTGALFALSAVALAVRLLVRRAHRPSGA
jgi:hypothetical protein